MPPRSLLSACFLLAASLLLYACSPGDASDSRTDAQPSEGTKENVILFTYFKGNGESGVFMNTSANGFDFREINNGNPIFTPPKSWPADQQLTRDPSVVYHDSTFHMVWTTNWEGRVFGYARSPDLKSWSDTTLVRPFPADLPESHQPNNVWAPEVHYDPHNDNFFVVFSSTIPGRHGLDDTGADAHGNNHRMYVVRTENFESFTNAELFYDPGFSSIDGQLVYDTTDNRRRWIMAYKPERMPEHGGKTIRLVTQDPETGTFSDSSAPIVGPGSGLVEHWVEGPTLLRMEDGWWRLYWDAYRKGYYGVVRSRDLESWSDVTDKLATGVEDPRHGTFFRAPTHAVGWDGAERP